MELHGRDEAGFAQGRYLSDRNDVGAAPSNCIGCHWLRVREVDHLPEQLPYIGNAFAALRLGSKRPVNGRHGAGLVRGMGAKFVIGDGVTEADVHSAPLGH
jgi:hypothetical protein